jgi:hypothetical protein
MGLNLKVVLIITGKDFQKKGLNLKSDRKNTLLYGIKYFETTKGNQ